jgi:hypothetical protein
LTTTLLKLRSFSSPCTKSANYPAKYLAADPAASALMYVPKKCESKLEEEKLLQTHIHQHELIYSISNKGQSKKVIFYGNSTF